MPATNWRAKAKTDLEQTVTDLKRQIQDEENKIKSEVLVDITLYPPPQMYYWAVIALYIFMQAALGLYISLPLTTRVVSAGVPVNVGALLLILQIIHLFGSFRSIGVDDLAGFSLYGRPWYVPKSGLYLVPTGILKVIRANRNYKDKRFPGPADKIFRVSTELQDKREGGDIPPANSELFRPIYVMTGEPQLTQEEKKQLEESDGGNPYDRQLVVEISYFVRYRPEQQYGGIFRIARNLSAQTGDIDARIEDLVREQSERDMKSIISRNTAATIIENWDLINESFILKLTLATMRLGIDIDTKGGGLNELNTSHKTNEEQANVARELFKKTATITKAEAESITRQKVREGDAKGEVAWLTAQAIGRKKIMEELKVSGDAVLASEAVRNVLANTDVILAGSEGGMKDMLTLVKGAQAAFTPKTEIAKGA